MTTPRPSSPPPPSSPRKTRKKTPSWKLASRTTRPPAGWRSASTALQQRTRRRPKAAAAGLVRAGPLPGSRRQAARGRRAPPNKAIEIDPRSIPAWTLAARVRESAGSLGDAAAALRRLAEIDRRNRTEHLTGVARLEARLGRIEQALKAGRDLLAAAPGNPESYEFFAQLCFELGRPEEGLDALRRAVRLNPNDTKITLTLARPWPGSTAPTRRSRCTGGPSTSRKIWTARSAPSAGSPSFTSSATSSTGS